MNACDIDVLARTIYGEARGECLSGQEAVASVVLNRVNFAKSRGGYWWGNTVSDVCRKPWQFSCWNANDPNAQLIQKVDGKDRIFASCKRTAARAVGGVLKDKTFGATHYHVIGLRPKWAFGKIPCAEIGHHLFYNDIEPR
nr:MAG TPA: Cell Wall Hydrolase [Caudoviricetes sp.]